MIEQYDNVISQKNENPLFKFGIREKTISSIILFTIFLISILIMGGLINEEQLAISLSNKNLSPSIKYIFGTDWMGRDMFYRTIKGLSLSMKIAMVGGLKGIVIGVSLTHWPALTRVIRAEVMQINNSEYVKISKNFGKSNLYIATKHILPHIIPQLLVGIVLILPHAVLHEASITFLGFGLPSHEPAIGIILSESMKYLSSGRWWLAFFPGVSLVIASLMVDNIGKKVSKLINPKMAYE